MVMMPGHQNQWQPQMWPNEAGKVEMEDAGRCKHVHLQASPK